MPAATITATTIQWPKGYVVAPNAFYHRALVNLDVTSRVLDVYNLQGTKTASYTLNEGHTFDDRLNELHATSLPVTDGTGTTVIAAGEIVVKPDPGCACMGYKRTPR